MCNGQNIVLSFSAEEIDKTNYDDKVVLRQSFYNTVMFFTVLLYRFYFFTKL